MKQRLQTLLAASVAFLARLTVRKYEPFVVGVTGSVGKTSTKEAIALLMRGRFRTRASAGNYNNEFGVPLAVLGSWDRAGGLLFWMRVALAGVRGLFMRRASYPEALVLEYAADRPGDIRELLEIVRPSIAVLTAIGDVPAHLEYYDDKDAVAREKARLIEALPSTGFAILNFDDESVMALETRTRAKVMTFGFGEGTDVRVVHFETLMQEGKPAGVAFKLEYGGSFVPVRLLGAFGRPAAYAAAAASAVAIATGSHLVDAAEALAFYKPPPHRLNVLYGIRDTLIIDDCYNASPLSLEAAMETVRGIFARRKIAVVGDMLELGGQSLEIHETIGRMIPKIFDALITVGPRAKFIAEGAFKAGMKRRDVKSFDTAEEARRFLQSLLKKGDLVLIKASRAMRLEILLQDIVRMPKLS